MAISFKGAHFPKEVMLMGVCLVVEDGVEGLTAAEQFYSLAA